MPILTMDGLDFKAYLIDTGLLYSLSYMESNQDELFYKSLILDKLHINEGMFVENYVSQVLRGNGKKLFFYEKRDSTTHRTIMEIDFLTIIDRKIAPIEVKSGKDYTRHIALNNILKNENYGITKAFVLSNANVSRIDNIVYYPMYMLMFIDKRLDEDVEIKKIDLSNL